MPIKRDVRDVIFFCQMTALASADGISPEQYISDLLWNEANQLHFQLRLRYAEQMFQSYRQGRELLTDYYLICSPLRVRNYNHTTYDFLPEGSSVLVWEVSDGRNFTGYRKYGLRQKKYSSETVQRVARGDEVDPPYIPEFKGPFCPQKLTVQAKQDSLQSYNGLRSVHEIVPQKNTDEFILIEKHIYIGKHIYNYNTKSKQPAILVKNDSKNVSLSGFVLSGDGLFLAGISCVSENLYDIYYETQVRVCIWDTKTGRQIRKWYCQTSNPNKISLDWHPKINCIAFHDGGDILRIIRVIDDADLFAIECIDEGACAYNPGGEVLVHIDCNSKATFFDIDSGMALFECPLHQEGKQEQVTVQSVCWHPEGREVACVFAKALHIIDWTIRRAVFSLKADDQFYHASYSPSGKYLAVQVSRHRVQILHSMTGSLLCTISLDNTRIHDIAWLTSDRSIALVIDEQTILSYTIEDPYLEYVITNSSPVWSVSWSISSSMFSFGLQNGQIRVWEAETYKAVVQFPAHTYAVTKMTWIPNTTIIATGSLETSIYLWDVKAGRKVGNLQINQDNITHLFWSKGKNRLASAYGGRGLYYWEIIRGVVVEEENRHVSEGLILSPDQQRSVSLHGTGDIWMCNNAGLIIDTLSEHEGTVTVATWSDDNSYLASGGMDGAVNLWDVSSCVGEYTDSWPISRQYGHIDRVTCLVFSPDGHLLASGGREGTVQIWNGKSGVLLATLDGHSDEVTSAAWSPDSTRLMTGSLDKRVCIWCLDIILQDD